MQLTTRFFALLATLLGPLALLFGQGAAPASAPTYDASFQVPTANDTSLLWSITGEGIERPSFVFGTIHMIPAEDYFLESTVVRAINESDEVLFEIDPGEMQNPAVMMSLMSRINMRGDTSLETLLSPARYDSVVTYFTEMGLPPFMLNRMKPMFLSSMVGQELGAGNPLMGGGGNSDIKSYELELSKIAEVAGKPIAGLETMEFQLGLFDSVPYTVQAEMLYRAVSDDIASEMTGEGSPYDEIVAMYLTKSVANMAQMITDESGDFGNFEELLLVRRNESWVPAIAKRLTDTPTVYAVGAGHLGGERGVIALLRAEGYTVEPVYP